jgi:hypothetical protein
VAQKPPETPTFALETAENRAGSALESPSGDLVSGESYGNNTCLSHRANKNAAYDENDDPAKTRLEPAF